ncbi:hypothetical protein B0H16DRAFT_1481908 [Mycena metata]|uniref:Chromo domain-containing protein n=1 Tax=Mycena metata TaxID=1033252 RepID=A0AAD7M9B0_9AGAR|nr:hypothetical protein B0H16DRAFT_1481908 [Mycena metata]
MESAKLQPFIHDTCVSVMHRSPTGRLVWSRYRIFYKRHTHLPHNGDLNVKGNIAVMKIMRKCFSKQVNLASADLPVARFAVESVVAELRAFQEPRRKEFGVRAFTMPGTFSFAPAYVAVTFFSGAEIRPKEVESPDRSRWQLWSGAEVQPKESPTRVNVDPGADDKGSPERGFLHQFTSKEYNKPRTGAPTRPAVYEVKRQQPLEREQGTRSLKALDTLITRRPGMQSSHQVLATENQQLRGLLRAAGIVLDQDYAQMWLMNRENENLCRQIHAKKNKTKRAYMTGTACLMTRNEMAQALLNDLQKKQMAALHSELRKDVFPRIKKVTANGKKVGQTARVAAKAAEKEAERARKAAAKEAAKAERAAAKAAKAAEKVLARGRGRGQGRARGTRGHRRGGGGKGRGQKAPESTDEGESTTESESSAEENNDARTANNPAPRTTESSDEEDAVGGPLVSPQNTVSAANAPSAAEDDSDDDEQETQIDRFNGHRWQSDRHCLEFQVVWIDGDVTWEPLSNVNDADGQIPHAPRAGTL